MENRQAELSIFFILNMCYGWDEKYARKNNATEIIRRKFEDAIKEVQNKQVKENQFIF